MLNRVKFSFQVSIRFMVYDIHPSTGQLVLLAVTNSCVDEVVRCFWYGACGVCDIAGSPSYWIDGV